MFRLREDNKIQNSTVKNLTEARTDKSTIRKPRPDIITSPVRLFCVLATLFGLALALLTPPFLVPDENRHFYRAYQLSRGELVGTVGTINFNRQEDGHNVPGKLAGGVLPVAVIETGTSALRVTSWMGNAVFRPSDLWRLFQVRVNPAEQRFEPFFMTTYSPVAYVPQTLMVLLGRALGLPPIAWMYAGRVACLACWIVLIAGAIRLTPFGKWLFLVLALTPGFLIEGASLSADCLTDALAFLAIAYVLYLAYGTAALRWRQVIFLTLLMMAVSVCKFIYIWLVLAFLLIPACQAGSRRRWWAFFLLVGGGSVAAVAAWSAAIHPIALPPFAGADPAAQWQLMRAHPLAFPLTLGKSIFYYNLSPHYILTWPRTFLGQLGWLDTYLPAGQYLGWMAVLLLVAILDGPPGEWTAATAPARARLRRRPGRETPAGNPGKNTGGNGFSMGDSAKRKFRLLGIFIGLATTLTMFLLLYLECTSPGGLTIAGWQGRYFYPVAPLFFLGLFSWRRFTRPVPPRLIAILTTFSLIMLIYTLVVRYWF